ncbi:FecR domain-containing protein [Taklimakanibacter deserti]|uniref:FecR domain-containing protein n=1 Tax=Taklimakanibacter deserti TaxID=2267839 RepID=UPI000E6585BA
MGASRSATGVAIVALAVTAFLAGAASAQDRTPCPAGTPGAPSVYIDSSSPEVLVLTTEGRQLNAANNLLLCPGDEIRTGATGRVAIRFDEKRTVIRLDGNSRTRILSGGTGSSDVTLFSGVLYFLSSVKQTFRVDTPYIVAGIEGTEALVGVDQSESLAITAVREGVVSAFDRSAGPQRSVDVQAGEAAYRSNRVPFAKSAIEDVPAQFRRLIVVSDSAVDWAIYYPPIMLLPKGASGTLRQAVDLLSSGDFAPAISLLDRAPRKERATAASLRAVIAVSRNRIEEAEKWSAVALGENPDLAAAHIAQSYVLQATGQLTEAVDAARTAAGLAPRDPYVLARLAELLMIIGDRPHALEVAEASIDIEPTPLGLFVAGLARLAAWQYERATSFFTEAMDLDAEAPLPRLGLGLTYIKQGMTHEGTWQIERAVAHDPRESALRTWLGRAYYDEGERAKAHNQFELEMQEDPENPNAYLFDAIADFSENRPIPALRDLQEAEKYADARRVLRSELGLKEDAAARGAALGRIYDVLSFDLLATDAGTEAVELAPANPGAHRFLADVYRSRQEYEIAQTSELLVSQLLSPPSKTPVQPELAETRLELLDTTGPARVTFAEFAPLFDADGLAFTGTGMAGTQDTLSGEYAVTGLYRNASISVGQYYYETDGYRQNNGLEHDIFDAVATFAITPEFSIFGEYRHRKTNGGDRQIGFDIDEFSKTQRSSLTREVMRVGFHAQPTYNSDLLGVYTWASLESGTTNKDFGTFTTNSEDKADSVQLLYIWNGESWRGLVGGSHIANDVTSGFDFDGFGDTETFDVNYWNGYAYLYLDWPQGITWTLGGALVSFDEERVGGADIDEFLPKAGVRARLTDRLTVRASYLENLKPELVSDQVIEPTNVAGFNQYYDAINGAVLEQAGVGLDYALTADITVGTEAIWRWWDIPTGFGSDAQTDDTVYRGYAYFVLTEQLALAAEVDYELSESDDPNDFEKWEATSFPVTLSYFAEGGWFGSAQVVLVDGAFRTGGIEQDDQFAVVNASAGYRFPDNRGVMSIEALNLFDQRFHYQNRTFTPDLTAAPRYAPELTVLGRLTLSF